MLGPDPIGLLSSSVSVSLSLCDGSERATIWEPGREFPPGTTSAGTSIWDSSLQNCKKSMSVVHKSPHLGCLATAVKAD